MKDYIKAKICIYKIDGCYVPFLGQFFVVAFQYVPIFFVQQGKFCPKFLKMANFSPYCFIYLLILVFKAESTVVDMGSCGCVCGDSSDGSSSVMTRSGVVSLQYIYIYIMHCNTIRMDLSMILKYNETLKSIKFAPYS